MRQATPRPLCWPLVLSLLVHGALLYRLAPFAPARVPLSAATMEVRLVPPAAVHPAAESGRMSALPDRGQPRLAAAGSRVARLNPARAGVADSSPEGAAASRMREPAGIGLPDIERMRGQARNYASLEARASQPAVDRYGDYFGTYGGGDSGTFFFHLDAEGRVSGSGESYIRGTAFLIEGEITPNGTIRMVGKRKAGDSALQGHVNGTLDAKTGRIEGTWTAPGPLSGGFSGRHE